MLLCNLEITISPLYFTFLQQLLKMTALYKVNSQFKTSKYKYRLGLKSKIKVLPLIEDLLVFSNYDVWLISQHTFQALKKHTQYYVRTQRLIFYKILDIMQIAEWKRVTIVYISYVNIYWEEVLTLAPLEGEGGGKVVNILQGGMSFWGPHDILTIFESLYWTIQDPELSTFVN